MQFFRNRHQRINKKLTGDRKGDHYPFSLQFYQLPPTENISLTEFETFAIERLKLLKAIENFGVSYLKGSSEYNGKLENKIRKLKFSCFAPSDEIDDKVYDVRRKDHISHVILRLAYCQSEDLRRWFIQQEMDLFKFRFNLLPKEKVQEFLKFIDLEYAAISEEEKKMFQDDLINSTFGLSTTKLEDCEFYKVPFQAALDLVRPQKVFLSKGFAYIPQKDIVTLILNDFRTRLSKALDLLYGGEDVTDINGPRSNVRGDERSTEEIPIGNRPDKDDKYQNVDPYPPSDKKEKQEVVDRCPPPDPKKLKQIIGELAFQLDRRILRIVFPHQGLYGYSMADIETRIKQVSRLHTGKVNGPLRAELMQRYRDIMDQLKKLGYDQQVHPYFTGHLINTNGIMQQGRTKRSEDITLMNNQQYVRKILEEYPGSDKLHLIIIFKCLAHLAERDGKPMFIWK